MKISQLLFSALADEERIPTPTRISRSTTPRRVQIAKKLPEVDEIVASETESISTAIDAVEDDDNIPFNQYISESPVDNMFANLVMNGEPVIAPEVKKKSPRRTSPRVTTKKPSSSTPIKFHHTQRTISEISDDDNTKIEEVPEEISTANYSDDFSVHTETSTPRAPKSTNVHVEKSTRKVLTDDRQVQVDLTSAPFQSSLNQGFFSTLISIH